MQCQAVRAVAAAHSREEAAVAGMRKRRPVRFHVVCRVGSEALPARQLPGWVSRREVEQIGALVQ